MNEEQHADIIIIGAGASGLLTAKELIAADREIIVLEARDRIGGRIHTLENEKFSWPVEAGAEFVHGKLEITQQLLKQADLSRYEMGGKMVQVRNEEWEKTKNFIEYETLIIRKLKDLNEDMSIAEFLKQYFPERKYDDTKDSLLRYIEGYDAADPHKASALAFLNEWENEGEEQYRIKGGYGGLLQWLANEFQRAGGKIYLSNVVNKIEWRRDNVQVRTVEDISYTASKVVVTIPLGVWQANENSKGAIAFIPQLPKKFQAAKQMGYGAVIKLAMLFNEAFWKDDEIVSKTSKSVKDLGFLISDAPVPTWWTQLPYEIPLLTGWLAGPEAERLKLETNETILQHALNSLEYLFKTDRFILKEKLTAAHVTNWTAEPYTRGAYAYATTDTRHAKKILAEPVENTLFFAGEALNEGVEMGTVEAAFKSAKRMLQEITDGEV